MIQSEFFSSKMAELDVKYLLEAIRRDVLSSAFRQWPSHG